MSPNTKRRVLETGEEKAYRASDSLQAHVAKLYQRAGIKGGSSHSGRRSCADKVLATTGDLETVALLLGTPASIARSATWTLIRAPCSQRLPRQFYRC